MERKLLRKKDVIAAVVILAVCAVCLFAGRFSGGGLVAEITVNGEVVNSIELSGVKAQYDIVTGTVPETVITVFPDGIAFKSSQCDNQLCVKSGKITRKGAAAVCLPARVVITLKGENGVDAITY